MPYIQPALEQRTEITEADYLRLETSLAHHWNAALLEFAASEANVQVYAVVAQFYELHGNPGLAVNTEAGFAQIAARYPDETAASLRRFGDARWDPTEFMYFDIAGDNSEIAELSDKFSTYFENVDEAEAESHTVRLARSLVNVLALISPEFERLNRTPDFISYLWPIAASESELIKYLRLTVPDDLFDRLFPNVQETETFMANLAQRSEPEQVAFWSDAFRDLVEERETHSTKTLLALGITKFDAIDALIELGPTSIPELVRIAEDHALAEEWNEKDSEEWQRRGASTVSGEIASSALLALEDLTDGTDEIIGRLQTLLQSLHDRDRGRALAGLNGQLTARALHALRPEQFPEAEFSDKTNHLLNFRDFGVT